jgi:(1->4)-alpha-D-glucan 1-alpha-D-glucosylmutase
MLPDADKPVPRATYRLQFTKEFDFDDAAALAPYLARLGISHVYASPYFRARSGSTHGYDIVSHTELNPELGGEEAFERMCAAFRDNGLSQIVDFVPNHMGIAGSGNPWWLDVLEWGPDSDFAGWFDIDWDPEAGYLEGKVLVPFLGDQYGEALEAGDLKLCFEPEAGAFAVWAYGEHKLPICPRVYSAILGECHPDLERLGDAFDNLAMWRPHVGRRANGLKAELAALVGERPDVLAAVEAAVAVLNGGEGRSRDRTALHGLIQAQYWRAAHFRVASDDINYRRFFNINDLAGIRIELPELFDHAHSFVFSLLARGAIDGLRIDHIDGLMDPKAYCLRLREKAPRPFYLVVEKILAPHERLREDWKVDGTTGYEVTNLLTGLLVDPAGEGPLSRVYETFTGITDPFAVVVRRSKLRIADHEMASELNVLAREASRIARSNPRTADFTNSVLKRALKQVISCFPVYRTYINGDPPSEADRRDIESAVATARRLAATIDPSVFDFVAKLFTGDLVAEPRSGFSRSAVTRLAMKIQQFSGPVMAKGLEDTAFYRYNRMLALNEVGGHPHHFGVALDAFHEANAERLADTPHGMLTTSTHDTKRGEDTRARLAVLSEMPDRWEEKVLEWSRLLRVPGEAAPSRNDEYAFYQLLLGAWPPELTGVDPLDGDGVAAFRERIDGAMLKSIREAKVRTGWATPDAAYETAMADFIARALDVSEPNPFLKSFLPFQAEVAEFGVRNSLVQTVLKLTLPGMPDIYQGAELWDFSLVDPDNRRPVDFAERERLLEAVADADPATLLDEWRDGGVKLAIVSRLLAARREHRALFDLGDYEPVDAGDGVVAFTRRCGEEALFVAAQRFPARGGAAFTLPGELAGRPWTNVLDGKPAGWGPVFGKLPVAVLLSG